MSIPRQNITAPTDKFVERHTRQAEARTRQWELIAVGYTVSIEWEAAKRTWRLVYWKEAESK
jgi:hypothetical protein